MKMMPTFGQDTHNATFQKNFHERASFLMPNASLEKLSHPFDLPFDYLSHRFDHRILIKV